MADQTGTGLYAQGILAVTNSIWSFTHQSNAMNFYQVTGRVFLGLCLTGLGVLHFFYPGIRPIIVPNATPLAVQWHWAVLLIAAVLIADGLFLVIGRLVTFLSLTTGIIFFLLFLFAHMPAFLSVSGLEKLKYWTNLNKNLALSGGFLILASAEMRNAVPPKNILLSRVLLIIGRIFFGCMLFLFGLGHFLSLDAVSRLVPDYIPFKKFWTLLGGVALMVSAISIFSHFRIQKASFLLAVVLFIWFLTLHLYYAIGYSQWQEGENMVGALTCLGFCGIALLLSQTPGRKFTENGMKEMNAPKNG